jgi:hypothetical protein
MILAEQKDVVQAFAS